MSECIGAGCTHPDHGHGLTTTAEHRAIRVPGMTPSAGYVDEWTGPVDHEEARRELARRLGWNPDKFAGMNRRDRRAAMRGHRRHQ